ncbi:hypothetical protein AAFF_G00001440 [Aldrovandia affinis]|uniref:Uncharacterized protein n=1 Tax=Aldrovandia affinis TaxID=143900 RepID=A0AAD7TD54_9TELE|nr:hypothetical protein AAFF_G00001440 [Aldrovandia affinis]
MWSSPNSDNEQIGQVTARMETTPAFGAPSISVSQQQTPMKFAPVVAPKPKFNPYRQLEDLAHTEAGGDYPPPPPPVDDTSGLPSPPGSFPLRHFTMEPLLTCSWNLVCHVDILEGCDT